ncbi:MAG: acetate--CoA ligase family protein [Anaerolineae bacterium]|nr:acetate--CoA ligase family protein [Anaerolineae bacterium]
MLEAFFQPKAVAIIGASATEGKLGHSVLANCIDAGYKGNLYPINPKADVICGYKAYPSVLDLPETPDLAVIVIPYNHVPAALRECGEKGILAVVIISAGFREAGKEGVEREREVVKIAKQYNIRVIGPNVLGIIDTATPLNVTFAAGTPPRGKIAFMSQSGALQTAILDWSLASDDLGFSKFVSLGNKADVSEIDLMQAWADDPESSVILAYIEGVPNGQEFIHVGREVSRKKPILVLKSGVTESGSRAVSSHTGSLAGSEQAYDAGFYQAGVLRMDNLQDLFDSARAFADQPLLSGKRIAIITNAGGPGILATDTLERNGLHLARFEADTLQKLKAYLPDAASANNPVDVLGDALGERYAEALEMVAQDPNVDGLLCIVTPQAMTEIEETAHAIGKVSQHTSKPVFGAFMGEARAKDGEKILSSYDVPNYRFPEQAAKAFAAMRDYRLLRDRPDAEAVEFDVDRAAVREVFEKVRSEGRVSVGEAEARRVAEAYGLQLPQSKLAATADEAVAFANEIGYPIVLKIASPDILHKTDVGGVKVNLNSAADVRDAFDLIVYRATRYVPDARIWGCLVQEMVSMDGIEVLVGMNRDPQFGPLVTFGLGGILVEVLKDVTFRIAPFGRQDAEAMLDEIRATALLRGVRGRPPADREAMVEILLRIGQLVTDFPEVVEMDINPLMVYESGRGAITLDMRLVLKD